MEVHGRGTKVDGVGVELGSCIWSIHPADQAPGSSKKVREERAGSSFTYLQA